MTPQEQAQAVMTAYDDAPIVGVFPRSADAIGVAAAIRAAVDLVLPDERRLCDRSWQRMIKRAQFIAIADALEGPADAS